MIFHQVAVSNVSFFPSFFKTAIFNIGVIMVALTKRTTDSETTQKNRMQQNQHGRYFSILSACIF